MMSLCLFICPVTQETPPLRSDPTARCREYKNLTSRSAFFHSCIELLSKLFVTCFVRITVHGLTSVRFNYRRWWGGLGNHFWHYLYNRFNYRGGFSHCHPR